MDDFIKLAGIENDIAKYEGLLKQARQNDQLPAMLGYEKFETAPIIERIIGDLKQILRVSRAKE